LRVILIRQKYHRKGGAENNLAILAQGLAEKGHEVRVLCRSYEKGPGDEVIEFGKITILPKPAFLRSMLFNRAVMLALKKEKYDIAHSFELLTSQDIYRTSGGCARSWNRVLEQLRPGLAGKIGVYARVYRLLEQEREKKVLAGGGCGKIIAISSRVKQELVSSYGVPGEKVEIIYNGAELEKFNPSKKGAARKEYKIKYGLAEDDFLVLFSGSGFERKGLSTLIRAVGLLSKEKKLKLLVAGHGKKARWLREAAKHCPGRVIFAGMVNEMEKAYAAADLFVLPSFYEPFGSSVLEALSAGLPVIVSRQCGASEIIEDGKNGLIVEDPGNPAELAGRIRLVFDGGLRNRLKIESRKLAETYSSRRYVEATIKVYEAYLKEKNG